MERFHLCRAAHAGSLPVPGIQTSPRPGSRPVQEPDALTPEGISIRPQGNQTGSWVSCCFVHPVAVGCCLVRPSLQGPAFPDLAEFGHHHRSVATPDLGAAQNADGHLSGVPLLGWTLRGVSHALVGRGPFSQGNSGPQGAGRKLPEVTGWGRGNRERFAPSVTHS